MKKYVAVFLNKIILTALVLLPAISFADYGQSTFNQTSDDIGGLTNIVGQSIGSLSGSATSISIKLYRWNTSSNNDIFFRFSGCNPQDYNMTAGCSGTEDSVVFTNTLLGTYGVGVSNYGIGLHTITIPINHTFNPTHFYFMDMSVQGASDGWYVAGSSFNDWTSGTCGAVTYTGATDGCGSVEDAWFWITTDSVIATTTKFTSFTPNLGTTTPVATSTSFTIGAKGYVSPSDWESGTKLYIRWRQNTGMGMRDNTQFGTNGETEISVTTSGNFDLSYTTSILNSGAYLIYYDIRKPRFDLFGIKLFSETLISKVGTFVVATATQTEIIQTELLANTTGAFQTDVATSDVASSTGVFKDFFNLPELFRTKNPTGYIYQAYNIFTNLDDISSTTTASLSLDFTSATNTTLASFGNLQLFSEETITRYMPSGSAEVIKTLLSAVTYVGLFMFLFNLGQRTFT